MDNERVVGHDIGGIKIGRYYYNWQTCEVTVNESRSNAKGSDANQMATVSQDTGVTIALKVLLGTDNYGDNLPKVNDPVDLSDISIGVSAEQVLAEIGDYSDFVVIGPKALSLEDGPGSATLTIQSGGKNPNAA